MNNNDSSTSVQSSSHLITAASDDYFPLFKAPEWPFDKWTIYFVEPDENSLFSDYSPKVLIDSKVYRKTVKKKNFHVFLKEEFSRIRGRKWHIEYQSKDYVSQFVPLEPDSELEDVDFGGAAIPTFLLCFEGTVHLIKNNFFIQ